MTDRIIGPTDSMEEYIDSTFTTTISLLTIMCNVTPKVSTLKLATTREGAMDVVGHFLFSMHRFAPAWQWFDEDGHASGTVDFTKEDLRIASLALRGILTSAEGALGEPPNSRLLVSTLRNSPERDEYHLTISANIDPESGKPEVGVDFLGVVFLRTPLKQ